eukprot:TRINITY_DN5029_c0_g4_i1.p1 TRINITY_DN5029_c0_g4~~TRINITY_DN5029_c0_g4_i1.p1  ORF type:complete len:208 (+),score=44.42 TRINITY_DN5029_c0_g4_i1:1-624(+)
MEERWIALMKELGVKKNLSQKWKDIVIDHYNESHRAYHTMTHLVEMFQYMDQYLHCIVDTVAVSLAIWFHDVIYEPTKNNNEEKSAMLFELFGQEASLDDDLVEKVFNYIIATKSHKCDPDTIDYDLFFFLDFDLAILGKNYEEYTIYTQQIREEYKHYSEQQYKIGRTKVLEHLTEQELFFTSQFLEQFDSQARSNIRQEILLLSS